MSFVTRDTGAPRPDLAQFERVSFDVEGRHHGAAAGRAATCTASCRSAASARVGRCARSWPRAATATKSCAGGEARATTLCPLIVYRPISTHSLQPLRPGRASIMCILGHWDEPPSPDRPEGRLRSPQQARLLERLIALADLQQQDTRSSMWVAASAVWRARSTAASMTLRSSA